MKVIILCGGQGTRLREETEYRPKPMVEIGGRPILWHIMKLYAHYGFKNFVLCLGYRGNMIKEYFLNYEAMNNDFTICLGKKNHLIFNKSHEEQDFQVTLANTGLESMTGARIKRVEQFIEEDTFMVTYGDGLSNVNLRELLRFHRSHGRLATVTTVRPISRFGILDTDTDGIVLNFAEKPGIDGWASCGFFVFNKEFFQYLSPASDCVLERDPLERLVKERQLMSFPHNGFFVGMDTYREYVYLNNLWNSAKAPWAVWLKDSEEH